MIRPHKGQSRGDALMRRRIAHWRRATSRLVVLFNSGQGCAALADEAHALRRQCARLAADLGKLARSSWRAGKPGRSGQGTV